MNIEMTTINGTPETTTGGFKKSGRYWQLNNFNHKEITDAVKMALQLEEGSEATDLTTEAIMAKMLKCQDETCEGDHLDPRFEQMFYKNLGLQIQKPPEYLFGVRQDHLIYGSVGTIVVGGLIILLAKTKG